MDGKVEDEVGKEDAARREEEKKSKSVRYVLLALDSWPMAVNRFS